MSNPPIWASLWAIYSLKIPLTWTCFLAHTFGTPKRNWKHFCVKPVRMCWSIQNVFIQMSNSVDTVLKCKAPYIESSWWRHQVETFSALLALCAGNSPVPDEFPAQRPVKRSFDVFFDLRPNKRLSKQSWGWWFEKLSHPLWRHCNVLNICQAIDWLVSLWGLVTHTRH